MTDDANRPFSSGSYISPQSALEAMNGGDGGSPPKGLLTPPKPSVNLGTASTSTAPQRKINTPKRQSRIHQESPLTPLTADKGPLSPDREDEGRYDDGEDLTQPPPQIVRALFDYHATDNSALSFNQGDLIEVFTMLESGWWDGMVAGERGWFPSNYVAAVSPEELEDLLEEDNEEEEVNGRLRGIAGSSDITEMGTVMADGGGRTIEIGPNGEIKGLDEEILALENGMDEDWKTWGVPSGSNALGHPARGIMSDQKLSLDSRQPSSSTSDKNDSDQEVKEFEDEIARRRDRMNGFEGVDEFGVGAGAGGRKREDTERTIRAESNGAGVGAGAGTFGQRREKGPDQLEQDYWVPSMTAANRIYYHNTQTGEDSWDLPLSTPNLDEDEEYGNDDDFFNTFPSSGPSSAAYATNESEESGFRSPITKIILPHPWVSRMSDDGREVYYLNQKTGQTSKRPPLAIIETTDRIQRLSVGSASPITNQRPIRMSMELQKKAIEEWQRRARETISSSLISARGQSTIGHLIGEINEALREVLEAASAGSAASDDLVRAENDSSQGAFATAILRQESAMDMLVTAHSSMLAAIRDLFLAFGYVGPIDKVDDMPGRPDWAGDVKFIASLGLLAGSIHAATTSRRQPEEGTVWNGVIQAASKVKDLVAVLPGSILDGRPVPVGMGQGDGKLLEATMGISTLTGGASGGLLGGRWGFGKSEIVLRVLDQSLQEVSRLKTDLDLALRGTKEDSILDLQRSASRFIDVVQRIDIASIVDIDYSSESNTLQDDVRTYLDLVDKARRGLQQLDISFKGLYNACGTLLLDLVPGDIQHSVDSLATFTTGVFRALSSLQLISQEQIAAVDQGVVPGKIGIRSPRYRDRQSRPQSAVSTSSRTSTSRRSVKDIFMRRKVRGLEEEYVNDDDDEEDLEGEERDRPGKMISASGSQSSLTPAARDVGEVKKRGNMSAASSSTSLAYQQTESDSSSMKGSNRSSFMKAVPFLRNRSGSGNGDEGRDRGKTGNKKLAKLLGEESLATIPVIARPSLPPVPQTPWYLGSDYGPGEIVYDDKGGVKAGTLRAFVERLTSHVSTESAFLQAFLLTYRSFASGNQIVGLLLERYHIRPPDGLTPEEMKEWTIKKQTPIRLRVSNTFKAWLDHYMEADDIQVLDRIEEFAKVTLVSDGSMLPSKSLLQGVQRRRTADPNSPRGRIPWSSPAPTPLLPKSTPGRSLKLTDISPLELARQLTILESGHFQKIRPIECLNKAWQREDGAKIAPNLRFVILTANRMAGWVASEILGRKDVKDRAGVMKHFVTTAIHLRDLNNFSSMAGLVAGLNSAPITRLKRTKELLNTKTLGYQQDLDRTLDSAKNFANYKELLKNINPPCVPFFGFYLSALTFIEDGNKDTITVPLNSSGSITPSTSRSTGMSISTSSSSLATYSSANPLITPTSTSTTTSAPPTVPPPNQRPISDPSSSHPSIAPTTSTSTSTTGTFSQPLINFFKRSLAAEILRDIKQYQIQPYNLQLYPPVYGFIKDGLEAVEKMGDPYELSLKLEPREREDERITRMLHDSRTSPSSSTSTRTQMSSTSSPTKSPVKSKSSIKPKLKSPRSLTGDAFATGFYMTG